MFLSKPIKTKKGGKYQILKTKVYLNIKLITSVVFFSYILFINQKLLCNHKDACAGSGKYSGCTVSYAIQPQQLLCHSQLYDSD